MLTEVCTRGESIIVPDFTAVHVYFSLFQAHSLFFSLAIYCLVIISALVMPLNINIMQRSENDSEKS